MPEMIKVLLVEPLKSPRLIESEHTLENLQGLVGEDGEPYDLVVGSFFICGLTADDFGSISDGLAEKYTERFRYPEMLMRRLDGKVVWFRIGSGEEPRVIG